MGTDVRKYSYTILLALSFLLAAAAWGAEYVREEDNGAMAGVRPAPELFVLSELPGEGTGEEPGTGTVRRPVMYKADVSWFYDALFIGDSRTVGLHEYGDLGDAEVLADSGMSVYKLFGKEFELSSGEKGTLEELLSAQKFGKIYLMLGINELGYNFERTVSKYKNAVERIQELQPDALIFLQANLHIAKEKSDASPIYNNENINRFNAAVKKMADGGKRFYLDVNELFDDEEGNLSDDYTADQAHVLGKYYSDWVEWILEHAVDFEETAQAGEQ